MEHLDLFSGIGGFALAARWVWGAEHKVVAFCENDRKRWDDLKRWWPGTPIIPDIKDCLDYDFGAIDILTGGFPCQPFSCAGKQRGTQDDRYLWKEMFAVIERHRPRWVIGENVAGLKSMVESVCNVDVETCSTIREAEYDYYEAVYTRQEVMLLEVIIQDLEKAGYEAYPVIIPAIGVDAPHKRARIWIVANNNGDGLSRILWETGQRTNKPQFRKNINRESTGVGRTGPTRSLPHADDKRCETRPERRRREKGADVDRGGQGAGLADYQSEFDRQNYSGTEKGQASEPGKGLGFGDVPHADRIYGNDARHGAVEVQNIEMPEIQEYCRWLSEPPVDRVVDGFPGRVSQIKGFGNAIVPQLAAEIFRFIKEIDCG